METANAGRSISGNLEVNDDNDSKIQLPLSAESLEKSSYVQDSPPICYVDLGCHKSTESDFQVFQVSYAFNNCVCIFIARIIITYGLMLTRCYSCCYSTCLCLDMLFAVHC